MSCTILTAKVLRVSAIVQRGKAYPEGQQQRVVMAMRVCGMRDTAQVLHVSRPAVMTA